MGEIDWLEYPVGATPLDLNETQDLIPQHISNQQQLNEWELANILEAEEKIWRKPPSVETLLTLNYLQTLHKDMFAKTWKWAGKLRKSNKNIGVEWSYVQTNTKLLLDDIVYQLSNNTYSIDEIAARFHHRLVAIHLFPNGNGRHSRLTTDILLQVLGKEKFSWGDSNLSNMNDTRNSYIQALRNADGQDYSALLQFVRS